MKISIFGCPHFSGERLDVQAHWFDVAISRMKDAGVSAALLAGDVFNAYRVGDRDHPTSAVVGVLRSTLERYKMPVFFVPGNHDESPPPHPPATDLVNGVPFMLDVSNFPAFPIAEFGCVGVGWRWMAERSHEQLMVDLRARIDQARECSPSGKVIVFGHMDLSDATFDSGRPSGSARAWPTPYSAQLMELGADGIYLSHIHKRQILFQQPWGTGGVRRCMYVGALWQHNMGEAGNPDGWVVLDSCGGLLSTEALNGPRFIHAHRWAEVPAVTRLGDVIHADHGVDCSRVDRSLALVKVLPVPVADVKVMVREDKGLRPGMTPEQLARLWLRADPDLEGTIAVLRPLLTEQLVSSSGVGLARVLSVSVFGSWRGDMTVDFKSGFNILTAGVGQGKTTILEAAHAAVFGSWPSRGRFRTGFPSGEGSVSCTFCTVEDELSGGPFYRVDRFTGGTLVLTTLDEVGNELRVEGEMKRVNPLLGRLLGSSESWLRSCMATQDGNTDLVCGTDSSRSEAFRRLLGLEELEQVRKACADDLKAASNQLTKLETRVLDLDNCRSYIAEVEAAIPGAEHAATEGAARLLAEESNLAGMRGVERLCSAEQAAAERVSITRRALESETTKAPVPFVDLMALQVEHDEAVRCLAGRRQVMVRGSRLPVLQAQLSRVGCASNLLACPLIDITRRELADAEAAVEELKDRDDAHVTDEHVRGLAERLRGAQVEASQAVDRTPQLRDRLEQAEAELLRVTYSGDRVTPGMLNAKDREVAALREEHHKRRVEFEVLRGRLVTLAERGAALELEVAELEPVRLRAERLYKLEGTFGRLGAPRELVALALPTIQAHLDEACAAYLPWLRVQFSTATEDDSGKVREQLGILVSVDGSTWADARDKSGGECNLVRLLCRYAISRWLFDGDQRPRVLFLDEPTTYMNPAVVESVIGLLRSMVGPGKTYASAIISTHDEDLALSLGGEEGRIRI